MRSVHMRVGEGHKITAKLGEDVVQPKCMWVRGNSVTLRATAGSTAYMRVGEGGSIGAYV